MIPSATELLSFFNLFAGVLLVASMILFFGGFAMYVVRLGTFPTYREEAIGYMKWGVATLFSLVVLLGIQQFLLKNLLIFFVIAALLIAVFAVWVFSEDAKIPEKKEARDSH